MHDKRLSFLVPAGHLDARRSAGEQCFQSLTFFVAKGVNDFNWLHLEGRATVLTEHGADCVQHYLCLGQICSGDLYEDILGVQADLQ